MKARAPPLFESSQDKKEKAPAQTPGLEENGLRETRGGSDPKEGYWELRSGTNLVKEEMEQLGVFELISNGASDGNGDPRVFIPEVEIRVENEFEIVDITIEWYQFDVASRSFIQVGNDAARQQIGEPAVFLTDYNGDLNFGDDRVDAGYDPFENTYGALNETWYVGSYPGDYDRELELLLIRYSVLQNSYLFDYRM